jgi:MFS family permease
VTTLLLTLAAVTAVGAAIRSTWSPCGLSMLSTITPLAERSRGRRWGATAAWFVLGAVLGGATLGVVASALAAAVGVTGLSTSSAVAVAAVIAVVAVALDLGVLGRPMPHHRRQVDEAWLDQFRSWVYGAGFGWQIGTGLATYIMTAGVYLTLVLAALTGSPATAFAVAVLFGFVRGLAILLGARLDDPERLRAFHRRFEAAGPAVRRAVIGLQMVVAVAAAIGAWGVTGAVVTGLAVAGLVAVSVRRSPAGIGALGREPALAAEA